MESRGEGRDDSGEWRAETIASALTQERVIRSVAGLDDCWQFLQIHGLPNDAAAMTAKQLDQLIGYHDELHGCHDDALARLRAVRDQIGAALSEHGGEVLGDLRATAAAPLLDAYAEASVEYSRCRREIEAVGTYAAALDREEA